MANTPSGRSALVGFLPVAATIVLLILLCPPAAALAPSPDHARPAPLGVPVSWGASPTLLPSRAIALPPMAAATSFDWDGMANPVAARVSAMAIAGEGASLAVDDLLKAGVLFGGEGPGGLTNLTLSVNETNALWLNVTPVVGPSPRANFSFASNPAMGIAVLFGGVISVSSQRCDNQTWVYSFVDHSWRNVSQIVGPPPREGGAFAVDGPNATGVLQGGWDPAYTNGGSTGVVTWNDTWTLNLTTFNWTVRHPLHSPNPMFGSSLLWAPPVHSFLLWGGCFTSCSNVMWSYVPGANWTVVVPAVSAPAGRAAADWVWGPNYNTTAMFGGFYFYGTSMIPRNDTYVYDPVGRVWTYIQGPPDPAHRFGAAGAWLGANQCPGLLLLGGSTALTSPPPDQWFLDSNPDTGLGCDVWGNDRVGTGNGSNNSGVGLPPGCKANASLSVLVVSLLTGLAISNANVSLSGYCGPYSHRTTASGYANFTKVPSWLTNIRAVAGGYRPNGTYLNLTPNITSHVLLNLTPLPRLFLHALGVEVGGGRVGLPGVSIWINGLPTPNVTGPSGWWNVTGYNIPVGPVTFSGLLLDYSYATVFTSFPYSGDIWVNLTMYAYGPFQVDVVAAGTGIPVPGAIGLITPLDPNSPVGATAFRTDVTGVASYLLPGGNFSVSASARGFLSNNTFRPVFHPWANTTLVILNLTFESSFTVQVRLKDATTHRPIVNGTANLGASLHLRTSARGWANFTGVNPAGQYGLIGSASGYLGNRTVVFLSYFGPTAISVELNLTPLQLCITDCQTANGTVPSTFRLIPPGNWGVALLTTAPLLLVVGALAYIAGTRRRLASAEKG